MRPVRRAAVSRANILIMAARDQAETGSDDAVVARLDQIIGQQAVLIGLLEKFSVIFDGYRPVIDKAVRTLDSPSARFARTWGSRG